MVDPLVQVLRAADAIDRVCITSFSDRRLRRVRGALGPRLCTAMGPSEITRLRLASLTPWPGALAGRPHAGAAQVPVRHGPVPVTDQRFVDVAHCLGRAVHVWTIDDASTMEWLLDLGVDGIMTDRPSRLREVLQRRAQWDGAA